MSRVCQLAVFLAFILAVPVARSAEENDATKQPDAKPTSVGMKSISYDPKSVEVPVGGSIVWTNKAFTNHTATSEDDGKTFDTGEIKPNESSTEGTAGVACSGLFCMADMFGSMQVDGRVKALCRGQ